MGTKLPAPQAAQTRGQEPSAPQTPAGPRAAHRLTLPKTWRVPAAAGTLIAGSWLLSLFSTSSLRGSHSHEGTLGIVESFWADGSPATVGSHFLMVLAAVVAGWSIARRAFHGLRSRTVGIELLVTIAAVGAILVGNYWESAAVTFLFAVGGALELATMNKTRSALKELIEQAPETAVVLRDGEQVSIPAAQVRVGETVLVRTGDKIAVDGTVIAGSGAVNEASITGESIPAEKNTGSQVFAGTVSDGGTLRVRAERVGRDTSLATIIRRVEEAQEAKAKAALFMDRFSRWYTPGIVVLAAIAGIITGDAVLALTLLVIGCPGALVISIPVSIVAGVGRAARDGVLIKGGEFLETTARVSAVALDKTGTLTHGTPIIADIAPLGAANGADVLRWAALAEASSNHPLAAPIVKAAREAGVGPTVSATEEGAAMPTVDVIAGKGLIARTPEHEVHVGNAALFEGAGMEQADVAFARAQSYATRGFTPMIVSLDNRILGVLAATDPVRDNAAQAIAQLHNNGVSHVVMLTGDAPEVAHAVAQEVGVDEVHAGLLPEDKYERIDELKNRGFTVAMVGDGINDTPALAHADIGVAMGVAGSGVAIETADIALMADNLERLPHAISLARRTVRTMRVNIAIALVTVAALLAGVLVGDVSMAAGMLVHEGSVLLVIANAMRLLRARPTSSPNTVTNK